MYCLLRHNFDAQSLLNAVIRVACSYTTKRFAPLIQMGFIDEAVDVR